MVCAMDKRLGAAIKCYGRYARHQMIKADTIWQQVCSALASDNHDVAFDLLEHAMIDALPEQRAQMALYMTHIHTLGDTVSALPNMQATLATALSCQQEIDQSTLYQILQCELAVRMNKTQIDVPQQRLDQHSDVLVRFHTMCVLQQLGQSEAALAVPLLTIELPAHLRWRVYSWQAEAQEHLGHTEKAINLYAKAAHCSFGLHQIAMWQEQAALLLGLGRWSESEEILQKVKLLYAESKNEEKIYLAAWYYLSAQNKLHLGDLEEAYQHIMEAEWLERAYGQPSYNVFFIKAHILVRMDEQLEAIRMFEQAKQLATEEDLPFVNHELGVLLLDLDRPIEALERLEQALRHSHYPYFPEVQADTAECLYRMSQVTQARQLAEQAFENGAEVAASLILANIAMDYYNLEEALEHYTHILDQVTPGQRDWILAHQMSADILAQQDFNNPTAIIDHAKQALSYIPESDDWHTTLLDYIEKAQLLLGYSQRKNLN